MPAELAKLVLKNAVAAGGGGGVWGEGKRALLDGLPQQWQCQLPLGQLGQFIAFGQLVLLPLLLPLLMLLLPWLCCYYC